MALFHLRTLLAGLAGAAVVVVAVPRADAQFRPPAPQNQPQPRNTTVTSVNVNPQRSGYVPPPPPGYYAGYGPVEYNGPWGGYLSGASDVINAQGNFMIQNQEAMKMKEDVKQAEIDTRRKTFDNWLYERDMTPTLEDDRERARLQEYRRSRNDPPLNEIWSGKALNDLLKVLQQTPNISGPNIPLYPEQLAHINVSSGPDHSGLGLLKEANRLTWPLVLQDPAYNAERKQVEQLLSQAMQQAQKGPPPASTMNALTGNIDKMMAKMKGNIASIDANDYIAAKRYLNELNASIKVLRQPNAPKYVSGQWSAQGNSVAELVSNMTRNGLQFAPATAGDQEYYTALHRAMVTYDNGMSAMAR